METCPCLWCEEHQVMASSVAHKTDCEIIVKRNPGTLIEHFKTLDNSTPCRASIQRKQMQVIQTISVR